MRMDANTRRTLSRNVMRLRDQRGWSQTDLAKRAGIAQTAVSYIERGNKAASIDTLTAIAAACDIAPWLLLVPLPDDVIGNGARLSDLVSTYTGLSDDGRREVLHVAEREAKYRSKS